jgi:hypothetical protein
LARESNEEARKVHYEEIFKRFQELYADIKQEIDRSLGQNALPASAIEHRDLQQVPIPQKGYTRDHFRGSVAEGQSWDQIVDQIVAPKEIV